MLKIFLSSHGKFASGIQSSCGILLGPSENLTVFDAYIDQSSVQDHLDPFFETVGPEDQVLLCSDLFGGSVNQVMYTYLNRPNTRLVAGVNMTFMMNILGEDPEDQLTEERLDEIIEESREYLRRVEFEAPEAPADQGDDFF